MNWLDTQYKKILQNLLLHGMRQENRTGIAAYKIPPTQIQFDMSSGEFPILTTKRVAFKTLSVELEGFIKGVTSKKWFQDRGCKIWTEWCSPQKVKYGTDSETQALMAAEDDLGPCIYGASWRGFHDPNATFFLGNDLNPNPRDNVFVGGKVDQLAKIVNTLKTNAEDRRMICLAWNPLGLEHTALPACHFVWQVTKRGEFLDLTWTQRSVDVFLGLPFNIASYGLLLHLLCLESGFKPGYLTGNLTDVHLYEDHIEAAQEQLARNSFPLPKIKTEGFTSIFDWEHNKTKLVGYECHPTIKAPVAV